MLVIWIGPGDQIMLPSKICYFWCICVSILFTGRSAKQGCALRQTSQGLGVCVWGGGGGYFG